MIFALQIPQIFYLIDIVLHRIEKKFNWILFFQHFLIELNLIFKCFNNMHCRNSFVYTMHI